MHMTVLSWLSRCMNPWLLILGRIITSPHKAPGWALYHVCDDIICLNGMIICTLEGGVCADLPMCPHKSLLEYQSGQHRTDCPWALCVWFGGFVCTFTKMCVHLPSRHESRLNVCGTRRSNLGCPCRRLQTTNLEKASVVVLSRLLYWSIKYV